MNGIKEVLLKMKLLDKIKMSHWAYYQCYSGNDIPEIRKLITHSYDAFLYCTYVDDNPEIRKRITHYQDLLLYHEFKKRNCGKIEEIWKERMNTVNWKDIEGFWVK